MLINAPLISPKIQHANKRTFEFQNPEILPDNNKRTLKCVYTARQISSQTRNVQIADYFDEL